MVDTTNEKQELISKPGFRKTSIPTGAAYCPYCEGVGCHECGNSGYYYPGTEMPIRPVPARTSLREGVEVRWGRIPLGNLKWHPPRI